MSAPGFGDAPISKGLFTLTLAASLALSLVRSRTFGLDLDAIVNRKEVWRIFTAPLASPLPTELMLSLVLLYNFRLFERTNGSRKFGGSLLFLIVMNTGLNLLLLLALGSKAKQIASGPYWVIFGLFVQYFLDIPQSTRVKLFNLSLGLSDKSLIYLMGLQLLFASSDGTSSLLAGATGVVSGILYRVVPAFSALRPPAWLTRFCARFCAPLLGVGQPRAAAADGNAAAGGYAQVPQAPQGLNNPDAPVALVGGGVGAAMGGGAAAAGAGADAPFGGGGAGGGGASELVEPSEDAVAQLRALGFDEARARQALAQSGNSVAIATARLVDS